MEFADGSSAEYAANVIAEAIYAQVDEEGRHHLVLEDVIDYRKSTDSCCVEDMWITSKKGNKHRHLTTRGGLVCAVEGWIHFLGTFERFKGEQSNRGC